VLVNYLINPWDKTHSRMDRWMDGWTDSLEHTILAGIPSCRGSCRPGTQTRMVRRRLHVCHVKRTSVLHMGGYQEVWLDGWMDGRTEGDLFVSCIYHLAIHIERV